MIRTFYNNKTDDFWAALRDSRLIRSQKIPLPRKDYTEIDVNEYIVTMVREHLFVLLGGHAKPPGTTLDLVNISLANLVIEECPDLAVKHSLVLDRTHEYWKK